ncbi:hypothetical protein FRB94_001997 [Tulasnella sp. JGI-2019a]|nr:hypothetical protein FRB94_001997 [Tulasnella sp. JGI-2019a]
MMVNTYFEVVEKVLSSGIIPVENIYGVDESGIMMGCAGKQKAFRWKGKRGQHSQQNGNHENVTVIETICASGETLVPIVIFKGMNMQWKWGEENPWKARSVYFI